MKIIVIKAQLNGLAPLMFDKFFDHSAENRPPEDKMYLDKGILVMPHVNLIAFLCNDKPPAGAVKMVEKKKTNDYLPYVKGHVSFTQASFPILDENNEPIKFQGFGNGKLSVEYHAGRTMPSGKNISIKQEAKPRPVLALPWKINLGINLVETDLSKGKITTDKLLTWFTVGGMIVALGTYRPLYGRFEVAAWEVE